MRNVFGKLTIAGAILSLSLTACSKGGGSSTVTAPATAFGVVDSTCVYNPASPVSCQYIGPRNLSGTVTVTDTVNFQAFLNQSGQCYYAPYACAQTNTQLQLNVNLGYQIPGPGSNFSLLSYFNGMPITIVNSTANSYVNAGNNGFQLSYQQYGGYTGGGYYGTSYTPVVNQQATLQIVATYTDATHNTLGVQIYYLGHQIATGFLTNSAYNTGYYGGYNGSFSSGFGYSPLPY